MPRTLVLEEAKPSEVTRVVRDLLLERGARPEEQTHARTVFDGLARAGGFTRGGYAGVYQPLGERGAEVHLEAWAAGPRRLFWAVVGVVLLATLGLVAVSPGSAVWFLAGLGLWALFGLAALGYYLTFAGSRALEDELYATLAERFRARWTVLDEEQQLERRIRQQLEGELKERELAALPPPSPPARRAGRAGDAAPPRKPGLFRRGQA